MSQPLQIDIHTHTHAETQVCLWFICVTLHIISYKMYKKKTNTYEIENVLFSASFIYEYIIYKRLYSLFTLVYHLLCAYFFWLNEFFNLNRYECYQVGVHFHWNSKIFALVLNDVTRHIEEMRSYNFYGTSRRKRAALIT